MIIVIDAYNVLKQIMPAAYVQEKERHAFIKMLMDYARIKKHTLVVVFDGGDTTYPTNDRIGQVTITYSGSEYTADDMIQHYLSEHPTRDVLLVTTDRVLNSYADGLGVPSLDAQDFYTFIKRAQEQKAIPRIASSAIIKTAHSQNPDLDALMHEASHDVRVKLEDSGFDVYMNRAERVKKSDRQLLNILKKL